LIIQLLRPFGLLPTILDATRLLLFFGSPLHMPASLHLSHLSPCPTSPSNEGVQENAAGALWNCAVDGPRPCMGAQHVHCAGGIFVVTW